MSEESDVRLGPALIALLEAAAKLGTNSKVLAKELNRKPRTIDAEWQIIADELGVFGRNDALREAQMRGIVKIPVRPKPKPETETDPE